jgi:hypothetical protein
MAMARSDSAMRSSRAALVRAAGIVQIFGVEVDFIPTLLQLRQREAVAALALDSAFCRRRAGARRSPRKFIIIIPAGYDPSPQQHDNRSGPSSAPHRAQGDYVVLPRLN